MKFLPIELLVMTLAFTLNPLIAVSVAKGMQPQILHAPEAEEGYTCEEGPMANGRVAIRETTPGRSIYIVFQHFNGLVTSLIGRIRYDTPNSTSMPVATLTPKPTGTPDRTSEEENNRINDLASYGYSTRTPRMSRPVAASKPFSKNGREVRIVAEFDPTGKMTSATRTDSTGTQTFKGEQLNSPKIRFHLHQLASAQSGWKAGLDCCTHKPNHCSFSRFVDP